MPLPMSARRMSGSASKSFTFPTLFSFSRSTTTGGGSLWEDRVPQLIPIAESTKNQRKLVVVFQYKPRSSSQPSTHLSQTTHRFTRLTCFFSICQHGEGVISVKLDGDKIVVVGDGVDSVVLTNMLRKKMGHVELVKVGSAEAKKEEKEADGSVIPVTWTPHFNLMPPIFGFLYEVTAPGDFARRLLHRIAVGPKPYALGSSVISTHDQSIVTMSDRQLTCKLPQS
ncbi:hypothetical protein B296_00012034 [Ensete ventricosum]|uniref:Uncharacterized protein n=1 Tax=Ensete ventricosum TaxID=4639 RepID=A0A427B388_ENSVE|nr:hypothetical protein B296_00012034 [Ensete ventricosum]